MLDFLQSESFLALLIAVFIFIITILLVVKRWISFPVAALLLLLSLATGLVINHRQEMQHYFHSAAPHEKTQTPEDFRSHMIQGMENLKAEITTEKENLRRVMNQVQEIFDSMDAQKQKLQHFIEEVREHFKTEPTTPPDASSSQSSDPAPSQPITPSSPIQQDHNVLKDEKNI